jgi:hypothetical protein
MYFLLSENKPYPAFDHLSHRFMKNKEKYGNDKYRCYAAKNKRAVLTKQILHMITSEQILF